MTYPVNTLPGVDLQANPVYRPIRLEALRLDTITGFDLYIQTAEAAEPILYRQHDLPFTVETKRRLSEHDVQQLLISLTHESQYRKYVEANLSDLLRDTEIELEEKTCILYECAKDVALDVLNNPEAGDVLPRSQKLVESVTDFMFREEDSFVHFLKTISFDYEIYTHSVNVFVYCINLAKYMGFHDMAFLQEFGTAAFLHDIGKSRIDSEILHCTGPLTEKQWHIMQQHPRWGYEILWEHGVRSEIILNVTRYHHEKMGGGGYPDGLLGDQIPEYVRIATVCDIFDALTTKRAYKPAVNSYPALGLMQQEMSSDLDGGVFGKFVKMMAGDAQPTAPARTPSWYGLRISD